MFSAPWESSFEKQKRPPKADESQSSLYFGNPAAITTNRSF